MILVLSSSLWRLCDFAILHAFLRGHKVRLHKADLDFKKIILGSEIVLVLNGDPLQALRGIPSLQGLVQ